MAKLGRLATKIRVAGFWGLVAASYSQEILGARIQYNNPADVPL